MQIHLFFIYTIVKLGKVPTILQKLLHTAETS